MTLPGFAARIASGAIPVLRVHYSADPAKRPSTPEGDEWLQQALAGYPGGMASARWRKEQEIDYMALSGSKLFPAWEQWAAEGHLVVPPFDARGYRLYGSYDHGWNNPAAFHVHGINGDGNLATFWEFYADHVPYTSIARIIKGEAVALPDGRRFAGNPFAGDLGWIVADPSMWAESQTQTQGPNKSMALLFRRAGVHLVEGERGGDLTVGEWLLGHYWADPKRPRYRICTTCPKLIWELGRLRHKEVAAHLAVNVNADERLVDKDNHAWDGLKMFLRRFPPSPQEKKPAQAPGGFLWWRQQALAAKQGKPVRTYRREMVG